MWKNAKVFLSVFSFNVNMVARFPPKFSSSQQNEAWYTISTVASLENRVLTLILGLRYENNVTY